MAGVPFHLRGYRNSNRSHAIPAPHELQFRRPLQLGHCPFFDADTSPLGQNLTLRVPYRPHPSRTSPSSHHAGLPEPQPAPHATARGPRARPRGESQAVRVSRLLDDRYNRARQGSPSPQAARWPAWPRRPAAPARSRRSSSRRSSATPENAFTPQTARADPAARGQ